MELETILQTAVKKHASDIHLKAGTVPAIRRHGKLRPIDPDWPRMTPENLETMAQQMMDDNHRRTFEEKKEVDLGMGVSGLGRFRVSIFRQRGTVRIVIRLISHNVPNIKSLNLPEKILDIANYERGLVLITGVTGSGKSSTLAAMIDHINRNKNKHILTIEDPIEYLIRDRKSLITQRELGVDANNFSSALRSALRQDPDVILIGEMRDRETIEIALTAAETGHLVFSTLHTMDATETVNRILAAFPAHQQSQVRMQLAAVTKAVLSQRLCRSLDKSGFVPAMEIMINNARIREMIQEPEKTTEIPTAIEEGDSYGMQSFDQSLLHLVTQNIISYEEALKQSSAPEDFAIRFKGVTRVESKKWANSKSHQNKVAREWSVIEDIEIDLPKTGDED